MWGVMDNPSAKLKSKSFSSKKFPETRIFDLHTKSLFQKIPHEIKFNIDKAKDLGIHSNPNDNPHHSSLVNFLRSGSWKSGKLGGTTPKMILKQDDKVIGMLKPFHQHLDTIDRKFMKRHHNTKGWATLATRDIFKAAGLGDHIEDVHLHTIEHPQTGEHVPVVFHKFEDGATNYNKADLGDLKNFDDSTHLKILKGFLLDFLTDNQDRHGGNIMIKSDKRSPLFIDHERNFAYTRPYSGNMMLTHTASPYSRSLKHFSSEDKKYEAQSHLTEWWREHRDAVVDAFNKHLEYIDNDSVKNHLRANFEHRVSVLDDLALGDFDQFFDRGKSWARETLEHSPDKSYLKRKRK